MKLRLQALWQNFENGKLQNIGIVCRILKSSSPKQLNKIPRYCTQIWICVIEVCSNGGATYIIGKIIAKYSLNIENLMQIFENLLLQNYSTEFLDIGTQIVFRYVLLKFVQMVVPPTLSAS